MPYQQEPVAIVGFACRLPGGNNTPSKLWKFLEKGEIAPNVVPESRFNINGHYDGSGKPGTMRPPGGMFLDDVALDKFDAAFFEISGVEATAMDPNQRQMLEVVVEGLENSGIPLEKVNEAPVACFVGSYASDYGDMHCRDPEDKPANCPIGIGRAIMANRISYCLNIKGPSITLDTACSGSLVGIDLACRSIHSGEVNTAIVAASNLYLTPEHVMDIGTVGHAHSPTALCHTFDASADGYVKAEAVSCVILKRLSDAIRDRDPVRAIIRGSASTSNGRTNGIASPNWEAQATAIRIAYSNAGISSLNETNYLECHGTGTQAGDAAEVKGIGSIFASSRSENNPLVIGSVKSNLGHSEPAAGMSGIIKTVLALETGLVPGTPLFITPNPKIDFSGNKVLVSRTAKAWPDTGLRRASINSFGFGGSNAHVVVEQADNNIRSFYTSSYQSEDNSLLWGEDEEVAARPRLVVLSANDATSLNDNIEALCDHLVNPMVSTNINDLSYTLSARRSQLWHRAFVTTTDTEIFKHDFITGKKLVNKPGIGFIFTGQGAQWPQMGKQLVQQFPLARKLLAQIDSTLQSTHSPPSWSLVEELTEERSAEYLRKPELSQTLVTALQLCIIEILKSWGVRAEAVIGHSSGEIAAAYAAGMLDLPSAIRASFYRGHAATICANKEQSAKGMLAVGLSAEEIEPFLAKFEGRLRVACFNSPKSLTISGPKAELEELGQEIKDKGHFSRLLHVDMAYHSQYVEDVAAEYLRLLDTDQNFHAATDSILGLDMISTVSGKHLDTMTDSAYWQKNMVSPVRFKEALEQMAAQQPSPDILIEIGPSGALAGPISQTLKAIPSASSIAYYPSWNRATDASKAIFDLAGHLFVAGYPVDMSQVNEYDESVRTIVDLPNYRWNHTISYWHESAASRDWRFKKFPNHDLIGSKTISSSWNNPVWHKQLVLADIPWLRDHKMGSDILIPGAGLVTMALEAMFQKHTALNPDAASSPNELSYRFKNLRFDKALMVEEDKRITVILTLSPVSGSSTWHEFRIKSMDADVEMEHSTGLVRIQEPMKQEENESVDLSPLKLPEPAKPWYKAQAEIGMGFGPSFQKIQKIESTNGGRSCRTLVNLEPPESKWKQSYFPFHPATLDCMLQTATPANAIGDRCSIKDVMVPSVVDELIINKVPHEVHQGLSNATSNYSGRGRPDLAKNWLANITIHDPDTGDMFLKVKNLRYVRLDVVLKPDPHSFSCNVWKPDVSLMSQEQLNHTRPALGPTEVSDVIDLICHKKPTLSILEVNLDQTDKSCLWFDITNFAPRTAYTKYAFASSGAESLVVVQEQHESKANSAFFLANPAKDGFGFTESTKYDLVIIKPAYGGVTNEILHNLRILLDENASILIAPPEPASDTGNNAPSQNNEISAYKPLNQILEKVQYINSIKEIGDSKTAYLCTCASQKPHTNGVDINPWRINIIRFAEDQSDIIEPIVRRLEQEGWVVNIAHEVPRVQGNRTFALIVDELIHPVLRNMSSKQLETLKALLSSRIPILWATKGSQINTTHPDNALIHGLFRVVRQEDPTARLVTLDTRDDSDTSRISEIVAKVLDRIRNDEFETEYAEREGIIHVPRVIPDAPINDFKRQESTGTEPSVKNLFETRKRVQLLGDRVGTLDMTWHETDDVEEPILEDRWIEVEVEAIGVNFKDVATAMGLVQENEHALGCECAGTVRRLGKGCSKFKLGDRVVILRNATFANLCRSPEARAHLVPSSMSFEEAATIPVAYVTALYSMFTIANLQQGQSVLIHSAAGGVGLAALQLAQYKNAEIFATVGTDEKRSFLIDKFGIPSDHIFSSRSAEFSDQILQATKGRGVDLILNSLVGDLLDASWRICADGGTMVEIGKKDILDRNKLSMEPFDRNCSFRAVDLSHFNVMNDVVIERLLKETFDLVELGGVKPIDPRIVYGFDDIPKALTQLRGGKHIGKMVISRLAAPDVNVPIKPTIRNLSLRSSCSYLIVGGLRGLCGSLAVHLARHGARHIITFNRSGSSDSESARVKRDCMAHGCNIQEVKGDVRDMEAVRSLVASANPPIGGVIQGAMVLRDTPYEMMSSDDYHTAVQAKVQGTWNIHQALQDLERPQVDFFTMLSSISGVVGNKGQANYAAANAFLDAFANYRHALGLPANSIDLGVVQDVGYVADQGGSLEERFDKGQWTPLNENTLRKVLTYSIMQQEKTQPLNAATTSQLITGIAYPLQKETSSGFSLAEDPRFLYLTRSHNSITPSTNDGEKSETNRQIDQAIRAFKAMHALNPNDTRNLVVACVAFMVPQITRLLRLETEIEPGKPLSAYGLDSLSAVELRGWVRMKLGAELSTFDITNASSLVALAEKLVTKMPAAN